MKKFKLIFDNNFEVSYKLYDNEVAYSWFELLRNVNIDDYFIESKYYGFSEDKNIYNIQNKLINTITEINSLNPGTIIIDSNIDEIVDEHILNKWHYVYEKIAKDKKYTSTQKSRKDVNNLNMYIHELEDSIVRTKAGTTDNRIRCRFLKKGSNQFQFEKRKIDNKYNELFNPIPIEGGIKLNYSQVGKDFIECYRRKDTITTPKPLEEYSASFVAEFGPYNTKWHEDRLIKIKDWYASLGYNMSNRNHRIGYIYVAEIENKSNIDNIISKNKKIVDVVI